MAKRSPALDLQFSPGPGAGSLQDFLYAELDPFEPSAIREHAAGDGWRVFFRTRAQRDAARAALQAEFRNALVGLSAVDVEDEDWARRTQEGLKAVRVGRIVVAPPWDVPGAESGTPDVEPRAASPEPQAPSADILIVIEPSMGFGTGHHETTRLCLALLQEIDVAGRRVIDVGTGSGVLAIAAARLGAASVLALDNDRDALMNARDNVARNGVAAVELQEADAAALEVTHADLIVANLTGAALQRLAPVLARLATPGGLLIVSGFAPDELPDVAGAFGWHVVRDRREGDWAAALIAAGPASA